MNTQDWFLLDGLVGSPCSPRDSQEPSPTPQFRSINSSALSFLYSPTLTSIHGHWKNHVYVEQTCFTVHLELTQHCKSTTHQQKKIFKYMLQTKSTSESAFRKLTKLYNLAGKERYWPRWEADRTSKERKHSDIHVLVTWAQRRTCVEVWMEGYCVYQKSLSSSRRDLRSHWLKMQRRHLHKITVKCRSSTPQEESESTLFWLRHQIPKAQQTYFLKERALRRASPVAQQ